MTTKHDPAVVTASVEEVLAAVETVDLKAPWSEVAPNLRLAMPRRRELPPGVDDLPTREYPPGIEVSLGLDIGPALLFVGEQQLGHWDVTAEEAFDQALANVRDRLDARNHLPVIHEKIADVPTVAFQSLEGWASSLLLLPDQLQRVLGDEDGLVIAPMRDLIMRLPLDTDPGFVVWLLEELASEDMNALDLPVFLMLDGELLPTVAVSAPIEEERPMH